MKAVPVLVVLQVATLALVALLFARHGDLEARVASLQAAMGALAPADPGGEAVAQLPVSLGADAEALAGLEPAEMEVFRLRVRRAGDLNAEEDRLRRFVDRIDTLVEEGRVAPVSADHKLRAARTLVGTRTAVPEMLQELRESGELAQMSREERRERVRAAYDRVREEAQAELETFLPAEDARSILADAFHDPQEPSEP